MTMAIRAEAVSTLKVEAKAQQSDEEGIVKFLGMAFFLPGLYLDLEVRSWKQLILIIISARLCG